MRNLLVTIFIIIFSFQLDAQETLTLNEAVRIGLQKNVYLQKISNNIQIAESNLLTSYGNFLPNVAASTSWGWTRSEDVGGTATIFGQVIPIPQSTSDTRNYSASISGSWTLFDGLANYNQLSKSRNELEVAKLQIERAKQEVIFQTVSGYYDVINLKKQMEVAEDNLKWNQKNLEMVTERNKVGQVTLADVYSQQVRTGTAELDAIRAKNNYETGKSNFLFNLGLDVLETYNFIDPTLESDKAIHDASEFILAEELTALINKALNTRSDFQSAQLNLENANKNITIANSGHLPSISNTFGFYSRTDKFDNILKNKTYTVGLALNIPIFSGWSIDNRVQMAEVDAKNKKLDLTDLEREIKKNLQKNYLDLQASIKRVDLSQKNIVAAEENRKIEESKYSLGSTTLLNVLIANSEYTMALSNLINAQFEFLKLKEQLNYYLGVLDSSKYE